MKTSIRNQTQSYIFDNADGSNVHGLFQTSSLLSEVVELFESLLLKYYGIKDIFQKQKNERS